MEDFGSFWTIQENVEELKQKLQYVTYELEMTRKETSEEIKKNTEHIRKLLQLLQMACKERDEAKSQVTKLQQILSFNNNKPMLLNMDQIVATPFSPDSPLLSNFPVARATSNSGLTESNSFSLETNNNNNQNNQYNSFSQAQAQSHVSSPVVDSLSYNTPAAASPESSTLCGFSTTGTGFALANTTTATTTTTTSAAPITKATDEVTLIIESLAKGRPRPAQGKLLQSVLEAGPLLQTLMVAGSLPRWRNPPGLSTQQIPPVNLNVCNSTTSAATLTPISQTHNKISPYYGQINGVSMANCPSSVLDFGGRMMMNSAVSFDCQVPKRQRLC